jgi:hypothetical protein
LQVNFHFVILEQEKTRKGATDYEKRGASEHFIRELQQKKKETDDLWLKNQAF